MGILSLPLLAIVGWMARIFFQESLDIVPVLIFSALPLLSLFLFILFLRKLFFVKRCINKNEKNIYQGIVQNLHTRNYTKLAYTIDDTTIEVFSHVLLANLVSAGNMKDHTAKLYTAEVSPGKQLLLEVKYDQLPPARKTIQTISATEKAGNNNKKDSIGALKITAVLLGILCAVSSIFFRGDGLVMIIGVFLFCFLLISSIIYYTYRLVEGYTEKYIIEGTITEFIRIRYKIGRYGSYQEMNWYRTGNELIPGSTKDSDGLRPGDTARFEYYAGKKKQRRELIRIIRL